MSGRRGGSRDRNSEKEMRRLEWEEKKEWEQRKRKKRNPEEFKYDGSG
jgi:hypothetical protein